MFENGDRSSQWCWRLTAWRAVSVLELRPFDRELIHLSYCNMDFIFLSSIMTAFVTWILVSYDIACQWSKKLPTRVSTFPPDLRCGFAKVLTWCFAVPKFHLPAHGDTCQSIFSLNYLPFSARTDGEGIERGWAHINPIAMSTREMGPGFRHDTLDVHWSALNWRKISSLGMWLSCFVVPRC